MTIHEHIIKRLSMLPHQSLSENDEKVIKFEGIETYIYKKLTSRKFRKTAIDADSEKRVREAILINVEEEQPIKFTYPFGGYKIWRLPSFPQVDWAEFMTISYVLRYVTQVAAAYKPGVEVYFSSDDVVIEKIDNYTRSDLDAYVNSFNKLLETFRKSLTDNIKIELKRVVPDLYTQEDYKKEMDKLAEEYNLSPERKERLRSGFEFNFYRNGKEDFTDQTKYEASLDDLMKYSDAYVLNLSKRKEFVRGTDKIVLFSAPIPNAIDIGSTNVSKAKFWAGTGVFEFDGDRFYDRILSPKQWKVVMNEISYEKSDKINLENFSKIPVIKKRLDFMNKT